MAQFFHNSLRTEQSLDSRIVREAARNLQETAGICGNLLEPARGCRLLWEMIVRRGREEQTCLFLFEIDGVSTLYEVTSHSWRVSSGRDTSGLGAVWGSCDVGICRICRNQWAVDLSKALIFFLKS